MNRQDGGMKKEEEEGRGEARRTGGVVFLPPGHDGVMRGGR